MSEIDLSAGHKPAHVDAMSWRLDSLITRFDEDSDEVLSRDELKIAKSKVTTDNDKAAVDFAERHFGALSLLNPEEPYQWIDGISRKDTRSMRDDSIETIKKNYVFHEVTPYAVAGAVAGAGVQLWSYAMGFGIPITIVGAGIGGYEAPKLDVPPLYGALAGVVAWGPGIFGGAATYFAGNHFNAKFTDTVEPQIRRMFADVPSTIAGN